MRFISLLIGFCTLSFCVLAHAHEDDVPFSQAILDPLELHHAHLHKEQRVNLTFRDDVPVDLEEAEEGERPRDVFENSYELAWASRDHRWGIEALIPFTTEGQDDGESIYGIGDVEIQPLQYAWVNSAETVFTTSLGFILPTGSERRGAGEGDAVVEPHLLLDKTHRNWFFGANLIPGVSVGGDTKSSLAWGAALGYSFLSESARPIVFSASLELFGESGLDGKAEGEDVVSLTPGLHLRHAKSGRSIRLGIRLPVTDDREEARAFLFQIS